MVGELNFGLLDTDAPAKAANSIFAGQQRQQDNALRAAQLEHAQSQNAMSKYTMQAAQRGEEQQQQLNAMVQQGFDPANPEHLKKLYGYGPAGQAMVKSIQEGQVRAEDVKGKQAKTAKEQQDFLNQGKRDILENPSDANVTAWAEDAVRKGFMTPEQGQASVAHMMKMTPEQRVAHLSRAGISAGELSTAATAKAGQVITSDHNRATEGIARGQLGVAQGQLGVSQSRLAFDKTGGVTAVNAKSGVTGAVDESKLKMVPVGAQKSILGASTAIKKIDDAIAAMEGAAGADATGWKGFLPDPVLNRAYPEGTEPRAAIADIGSLILHDRSGAAVTASESPRLMPFIPSTKDTKATALTKLRRLRQIQVDDAEALAGAYTPGQGFRAFSPGAKPATPAPAGDALTPAEQKELEELRKRFKK